MKRKTFGLFQFNRVSKRYLALSSLGNGTTEKTVQKDESGQMRGNTEQEKDLLDEKEKDLNKNSDVQDPDSESELEARDGPAAVPGYKNQADLSGSPHPANYPRLIVNISKRKTPTELIALKDLIKNCYPDTGEGAKEQILFCWYKDWLSKLSKVDQRKFLYSDPFLPEWVPVFKRDTSAKCISFNLSFLEVFETILDPGLWAGKSFEHVLLLYYIFLTKRYIVWVEDEGVFYQYTGSKWQVRIPMHIMADVMSWLSKLSIKSVDTALSEKSDASLIVKVKSEFTIKTWPRVMGKNLANGFCTLVDGKYTLFPHHPNHWAKNLIELEIPDDLTFRLKPEIVRWLFDLSGENCLNSNQLKLGFFFCLEEGPQNIIYNLAGSPRGAKTALIKAVQQVTGDGFKTSNIDSLNPFQREAALLNARVIVFPDVNPKGIQGNSLTFLKNVVGADPVAVAHKHGDEYYLTNRAFMIITSNTDFDAVPAFREDGMADRVISFETPSVDQKAVVPDILAKFGKENIESIFRWSLTIDPAIVKECNRASNINALTGAGSERNFIVFLTTQCVYIEGEVTQGQKLFDQWKVFMKTIDPKYKPGTQSDFYKKLASFAGLLQPAGIRRKSGRASQGVVFFNIAVGEPNTVPKEHTPIVYAGSSELADLFNRNSMRSDWLVFRDETGELKQGPRLNPEGNIQNYHTIQNVKNTNLKNMFENKEILPPRKHLMPTGIGGNKFLYDLTLDDFVDKEPVRYQPRLQYVSYVNNDMTSRAVFKEPDLLPYLSGEVKPMLVWYRGDPTHIAKVPGVSADFKFLSEYTFETDYCLNKSDNGDKYELFEKYSDFLQRPNIPPKLVDFETYYPKALPEPSPNTQPVEPQPTKPKSASKASAEKPQKRRGRKPKAAKVAEEQGQPAATKPEASSVKSSESNPKMKDTDEIFDKFENYTDAD